VQKTYQLKILTTESVVPPKKGSAAVSPFPMGTSLAANRLALLVGASLLRLLFARSLGKSPLKLRISTFSFIG
jgi:hypothetical protein